MSSFSHCAEYLFVCMGKKNKNKNQAFFPFSGIAKMLQRILVLVMSFKNRNIGQPFLTDHLSSILI